MVSVTGFSAMQRNTISWPGPPRRRPGPPESCNISLRTMITGHLRSMISVGVTVLLWG